MVVEICTEHGQNSICICKKIGAFIAQIFTELQLINFNRMEIFYADYHPDRSRNMCITGSGSFRSVNKAWLSLGRFSRNSRLLDSFLSPLPDFTKILQTV